jgi:hypothetical protein
MRRACIVAVFVAAWLIGPVARVPDAAVPAPTPQPTQTITVSR